MNGSVSSSNETLYTLDQVKNAYRCSDRGLLLPLISEFTWLPEVRAFIYLVGMFWCFMAISIVADIFMCAIEKVTSKTRKIKIASSNKEGFDILEIRVWNDTVANLSLMALGTSAPEILLSIIEIVGKGFVAGELGPSCIVGSASFNLMVITAVCVIAIPDNEVRIIKSIKVFFTTSFFGLFAYVWMIIVLVAITPDAIDVWEAVVTLLFFPTLIILAYLAEKNFFRKPKSKRGSMELGFGHNEANAALLEKYGSLWKDGQVDKKTLASIIKEIAQDKDLSDEDKVKIAVAKITSEQQKNRGWYRINASRMMFGQKALEPRLNHHQAEVLHDITAHEAHTGLSSSHRTSQLDIVHHENLAVIEFTATSVAILENEQKCHIGIKRSGKLDCPVLFKLETIDGSATAGEDYIPVKETLTFQPGQTLIEYTLQIIDDDVYEPDETFFVKLSLEPDQKAILGPKSINMITIINDDLPGTLEFDHPSVVFKETVGVAAVKVNRLNGADGKITVSWKTEDMTAISGKDFEGGEGELTFDHGEIVKTIEIPIFLDKEKDRDEHFKVVLLNPSGGAQLGTKNKTFVTIVNDDDYEGVVSRLVNMTNMNVAALTFETSTWAEQFRNALNVNGGDIATATTSDYIMHFLTFGFKIIFAFIPPTIYCGGWLTFFVALGVIGLLTAIVGDLAAIFGCLCGLRDDVTAITFVAMGTSVPDLFASKQAAANEKTADNSIGNIMGSNSVNVFLGLGLPWTMAAIYHYSKSGQPFAVPAGTLGFSVMLYAITCLIAVSLLVFRHYVYPKGELGGARMFKWFTFVLLVGLWLCYILVSSFQSYGYIRAPF